MAKEERSQVELQLERMQRQLAEQMDKMSLLQDQLDKKEQRLIDWEKELEQKIDSLKSKKKASPDDPVPYAMGIFRNLKEPRNQLPFCYQTTNYQLSDGVKYCLPKKVADSLNSITKRAWEEDENGYQKPTEKRENQYLFQEIDHFFKDPKTNKFFKIIKENGQEVRVPYSPQAEVV